MHMNFGCHRILGTGCAVILVVALIAASGQRFVPAPVTGPTVRIAHRSLHPHVSTRSFAAPGVSETRPSQKATGMIVTLDKAGRPTEPDRSAADWQALRNRMDAGVAAEDGPAPAVAMPGGGVMVRLGDAFRRYSAATIGPDGTVRKTCTRASQVAKLVEGTRVETGRAPGPMSHPVSESRASAAIGAVE